MALFTTILGSAFLATVANAAVTAIGLSLAQKALRKKKKTDVNSIDAGQQVSRTLAYKTPLSVVVGRRGSGGAGYYDDAHGTNNEYGISVTVHSSRPVHAHKELRLDTELAALSGDPTTGEVSVTNIFLGKSDARRVKYRFFKGNNNSALGAYLASITGGQYSASDNFGECAVSVLSCRNTNDDIDAENNKNLIPFQTYPKAIPDFEAVFVCDPRISGSDYDNPNTYVYSANAALIEAQYDYGWYDGSVGHVFKIVGNGYPVELLDIDQIKSNADYCDVRGYECNGTLRSGKTDDQEEIRKCYNATRYEVAGKVYSLPEGNRPVYGDLDLSLHIAAKVTRYDKDGEATNVYNQMQTHYIEPAEQYGDKELPLYTNAQNLADDGGIPRETSLPLNFVTKTSQASRLQKEEMAIMRATETCQITDLPLWRGEIVLGSILTLKNTSIVEINDRQWVVEGKHENARDVSLSLRIYVGDATFVNPSTPVVPIYTPPARAWPWWEPEDHIPANAIAVVNGALNVTNSALANVEGLADITKVSVLAILNGTAPQEDINLTGIGSLRGQLSVHTSGIDTALGVASSASGDLIVTISGLAWGSSSNGVQETTGSVTANVSGGTGTGYGGTWSRVSGAVFTIDAVNAFTTTFTGTPTTNMPMDAVYKFTAHDDGSGTAVKTVSVSMYNYDETGSGGLNP